MGITLHPSTRFFCMSAFFDFFPFIYFIALFSLIQARLRDTTAECRKVARQIGSGGGHDAALLQKADVARDLVDEVAAMCADRTEVGHQNSRMID